MSDTITDSTNKKRTVNIRLLLPVTLSRKIGLLARMNEVNKKDMIIKLLDSIVKEYMPDELFKTLTKKEE